MAEFTAELSTLPTLPGEARIASWPAEQERTNTSGGGAATVHYFLTAICSTGNIRKYWVDTSISLTNAPSCGGGYVSGTLTVLGKF